MYLLSAESKVCVFYVPGAMYLLSAESKLQNLVRGFHQDVYRLAKGDRYICKNTDHDTNALKRICI